jgi:phenylpropionate dioxygenase-like ring-hydroxylating dioxygenase large terminal subunit
MKYLKNVWYAAAWAEEIAPGALFARTIIEEPLVFFRDAAGALVALHDRCPHRFAALSLGTWDGATLECRYHGLRFDTAGACVGNPHGPLSKSHAVRTFTVVERHALVWVWLGDDDLADPATIPDLAYHDAAPATAFNKGYLHASASHHLMVDNILDLSHADTMHPESLGNGWITRNRARIEEKDDTLFVEWLGFNEPLTPLYVPEFEPGSLSDVWLSVLWYPSGAMVLRSGMSLPGLSQEEGIDTLNSHIMTPESAGTTHYFHSSTRTYRIDAADYNQAMYDGLRWAFEHQDRPMIEAQQKRIGSADLMDLGPALMEIDAAPVKARRMLNRLIAAEAAKTA